jgi:hypothetical protein
MFLVATGRPDAAREEWSKAVERLQRVGDRRSLASKVTAMREVCAKAGIEPFSGER